MDKAINRILMQIQRKTRVFSLKTGFSLLTSTKIISTLPQQTVKV